MTDHKALRLFDVLRDQRQCDEDGVMCIVSRQAVDEAVQIIEALTAAPAASEGEDGAVGGLRGIIGSMRNFASVADGCTITEVTNAPAAIRAWADMLEELRTRPAAQVAAPAIPPAAVKVSSEALLFGAGLATASDWAIPRGHGVTRIVDERMAYGWNQCREAMLELTAESAAQVAATPKHDEGREAADALRQAAEYVCTAAAAQNVLEIMRGCERLSAALATQPAARRVTEQDVDRALNIVWPEPHNRYLHENWRGTVRKVLESFAQPAEGVSGGNG